jgi:predicted ATPase
VQIRVPAPLTTLVGRRAEITELATLLADRRLVTLTGVGGCGKTRLAIAVAERIAGRFPDGVRFVDLSALSDPGLVPGAVAAEFGLPDAAGADPAALAAAIRTQRCLLVLDNCEHVVPVCAELAGTLLRSCPDLRVLATSREVLGVPGELAWPVPPLSMPGSWTGGLADVRRYDAVRLFLDRADVAAVRDLGDRDAGDVAALCARLDGLPLAIELAAARTGGLSVAEIAGRLHDPALLHTPGRLDRPHHRAMHTTIAWSYDLLDPRSQDRFRRLAVFTGGFTLTAAEAVWQDRRAVDLLADLVAKSLVVVERTPTGTRYRLLETIGRWAAARLAESPDTERGARARHAAHYLTLAEEADRQLHGTETGNWLARLSAEHENLRSALAWFAGRDPVGMLRLALALAQYCRLRGRYREGRRWLEQALAGEAAAPAELAGKALAATATLAMLSCDYGDAQRLAERALAAQLRCQDRVGEARSRRLLAAVTRERGDYPRALAELERAAGLADPDDLAARISLLYQVGFTHWLAGDLDRADDALTTAQGYCERLDDPGALVSIRIQLAAVALYRGELGLAERLAGDSLDRSTQLDFKEGVAWSWNLLGVVALRQGRQADAVAALRASLEVHDKIGDRWRQASVVDALAEAALAAGDPVRAAELTGLADAVRGSLGVAVPTQERPARAYTDAILRRALPDADRHAAAARGAASRVPDVLAGLQA